MIDTVVKLKLQLKVFKLKMLKQGVSQLMLYPIFCSYYDKNKETYALPVETVLNLACEILIEGSG